jgi:predicted small lipoprotein YifL
MTLSIRTLGSLAAFTLLSINACAQTPAGQQGPYLPPALRSPPPSTPTSGAALRNEAMDKLKKRFQEADLDASGSVTRDEAKRAGLGFVENNFDEIDTAGRGQVSFDEVRKFMAQRGK